MGVITTVLDKGLFSDPLCKKQFIDRTLIKDTFIDQWRVPKGTVVKVRETKDFGLLVLPHNTKDTRGFIIPQRLFRW